MNVIREAALPTAAGFATFLFGLKLMETALHLLAGPQLLNVLRKATKTPMRGMAVSTAVTALVQSSTAVSVLTVGLVNSGLIRFPQTLGVILGANIGTAATTELLGLSVHRHAPEILFASVGA